MQSEYVKCLMLLTNKSSNFTSEDIRSQPKERKSKGASVVPRYLQAGSGAAEAHVRAGVEMAVLRQPSCLTSPLPFLFFA